MCKKKIILIVVLLALAGGIGFLKWKSLQQPKIKYQVTDATKKIVAFDMRYKGMQFKSDVSLGGLKRQEIGDYVFEAKTEGNSVVLRIVDKSNKVIATRKIPFNA